MTYIDVDDGLYLPVEEFSTSRQWAKGSRQYTFADCFLLTADFKDCTKKKRQNTCDTTLVSLLIYTGKHDPSGNL